jgi:3'(2'), 5'-bisphosphate nucleotidase
MAYVAADRNALDRLIDIACAAGRAAMRHYGDGGAVQYKAAGSPVTAADRAAHECIVAELRSWDPGIPVISEEGIVPSSHERALWRRFWLVDPLDGTKEFIAANGEFTVNIALIEDGQPILGVVAAPALEAVYFAGRQMGAWRRESSGRSEPIVGGTGRDGVIRIVESRSHPSPELEAFIADLGVVERIRLGSSLKFCRVAEGRADLYPRFGPTMEWDVAAGDCIYRNSGPDGRERSSPLVYNQPSLTTPSFIIGQGAAVELSARS